MLYWVSLHDIGQFDLDILQIQHLIVFMIYLHNSRCLQYTLRTVLTECKHWQIYSKQVPYLQAKQLQISLQYIYAEREKVLWLSMRLIELLEPKWNFLFRVNYSCFNICYNAEIVFWMIFFFFWNRKASYMCLIIPHLCKLLCL